MPEIIYRQIKEADYEDVIALINSTWEIDQYLQSDRTLKRALSILLSGCLSTSTYGMVATTQGSVVGFILGRAKNDKKRPLKTTHGLRILKDLIAISFAHKADRKNIKEYLRIPKVYQELIKGRKYAGEVVFFAVSSEYRGMGIGKRLMNDLKDYFSKMSAESISVFTDSKCNYGFYDSQGFRRIGTKDVVLNMTPEMGPMRIFLYDYHHQP